MPNHCFIDEEEEERNKGKRRKGRRRRRSRKKRKINPLRKKPFDSKNFLIAVQSEVPKTVPSMW